MSAKLEIVKADITTLSVDAMSTPPITVCWEGAGLMGRFIARQDHNCLENVPPWRGFLTGEAKITKGYRLPARFVIHIVGPIWRRGSLGKPELLANCYQAALR